MSSTGTMTSISIFGAAPASTISTGRQRNDPSLFRERPPRNREISSSGRCVADSPMRCTGRPTRCSKRSRLNAMCAPRLVPATEWISSMMTASTWRNVSRAAEVSIKNSDSGVVIKRSGGFRTSLRRSSAGVSPVRMPTEGTCTDSPKRSAAKVIPRNGDRRFFSTSTANARSGERYNNRVRASRSGTGSVINRSIPHKKAANVLPEPVGDKINVFSPDEIAGHPAACGGVGDSNDVSNHSFTDGENRLSTGADIPTDDMGKRRQSICLGYEGPPDRERSIRPTQF